MCTHRKRLRWRIRRRGDKFAKPQQSAAVPVSIADTAFSVPVSIAAASSIANADAVTAAARYRSVSAAPGGKQPLLDRSSQ